MGFDTSPRQGTESSDAAPAPAPFIVGVPRSGTTLLRLMLDAHPDLAIPGETHFIPRLIRAWQRLEAAEAPNEERVAKVYRLISRHPRWEDFEIDADALRGRLEEPPALSLAGAVRAVGQLHAAVRGKTRWGDKSPGYATSMPAIQAAVPEARFIHVIRDGRDVAASLLEVSWGPDDPAEAARLWTERIAVAQRDAAELAPGTYVEVRYEELATDPEPVMRELMGFLEIEWLDAVLHHHERAAERMAPTVRDFSPGGGQVVSAKERARQHASLARPVAADRISRWRRSLSDEDVRRFEEIAAPTLAALGYDTG